MEFKLKDKVVYPGHGVAVVDEIVEKKIGVNVACFFKLTFLYKDMTILVPINNAKSIGIRHPSSPVDIAKAQETLQEGPARVLDGNDFSPSGWNKRNKDYQQKIQTGLLVEIAKIYRDLMHVSYQKDLSFGEKNLLQSTEDLLAQELQTIQKKDKESILQEIRNPFKKSFFPGANRQDIPSSNQNRASSSTLSSMHVNPS